MISINILGITDVFHDQYQIILKVYIKSLLVLLYHHIIKTKQFSWNIFLQLRYLFSFWNKIFLVDSKVYGI